MAKIIYAQGILHGKNNIGFMRLREYENCKYPQIELELEESFRGKGIMKRALPRFLKDCHKNNHTKLIALVKEDNIASLKLIKANHFVKVKNIKEVECYVCDLEINEICKNMQKNYDFTKTS